MNLNVGDRIRCLRHEKDITQEEFAVVLGVSCQSVSRWENGICYPDIELLSDGDKRNGQEREDCEVSGTVSGGSQSGKN